MHTASVKEPPPSELIPLTASHFPLTKEGKKRKRCITLLTFDSLDLEADLTDAVLFPTSRDGKKYQNALLISQ